MAVAQLNEVLHELNHFPSCNYHVMYTVDETDEDSNRETPSLPISDSFLSANIQNMPPKLRCIHST